MSPPDANGITVVDFEMAVRVTNRTTGDPVVVPKSRYRARLKREGSTLVLESLIDRSGSR